jgi:hypothetical protein
MSDIEWVSIPGTRKIDFTSNVNGRRYSIRVGMPLIPPPEMGYPVFYILDGNGYFASAVEAVRENDNAPHVLVVGIGYPDDSDYVEAVLEPRRPLPRSFRRLSPQMAACAVLRDYDLTLPATDEELARQGASDATATDFGGLDDFLATIETDVKPRVATLARTDPSNQAIFGHSLGGLAVIHALFTEPGAFRTFIAASPALCWNERAVLAGEAEFAHRIRSGGARPRVLITMGSEESTADPRIAAELGIDAAEFEELIKRARMVENARELTRRLQILRLPGALEVEDLALFEKQNHGISPWPALGRGIVFAFSREGL